MIKVQIDMSCNCVEICSMKYNLTTKQANLKTLFEKVVFVFLWLYYSISEILQISHFSKNEVFVIIFLN